MVQEPDYRNGLAVRSTYVENVLIHSMIAGLAAELWKRDPAQRLHIFKAEVDDSGFDLVLGIRNELRYIQVKQCHEQGKKRGFSIQTEFSRLPGSCAVLIVHAEDTLAIKHFEFYGEVPGLPMPNIEHFPPTQSSTRKDSEGNKRIREHYRDVPRTKFKERKLIGAGALLDALFPCMMAVQTLETRSGSATSA